MAADQSRIIRRHKKRTDDGKGHRRYIAGRRFRLPAGVEGREADERFLRIERLWKDNEVFFPTLGTRRSLDTDRHPCRRVPPPGGTSECPFPLPMTFSIGNRSVR
jgi:hypothetical protein